MQCDDRLQHHNNFQYVHHHSKGVSFNETLELTKLCYLYLYNVYYTYAIVFYRDFNARQYESTTSFKTTQTSHNIIYFVWADYYFYLIFSFQICVMFSFHSSELQQNTKNQQIIQTTNLFPYRCEYIYLDLCVIGNNTYCFYDCVYCVCSDIHRFTLIAFVSIITTQSLWIMWKIAMKYSLSRYLAAIKNLNSKIELRK